VIPPPRPFPKPGSPPNLRLGGAPTRTRWGPTPDPPPAWRLGGAPSPQTPDGLVPPGCGRTFRKASEARWGHPKPHTGPRAQTAPPPGRPCASPGTRTGPPPRTTPPSCWTTSSPCTATASPPTAQQ
jgi:hypothetical protein